MSIHGDETSSDVNQDLFLMRSNLNGVATWIKNYDLTNYSEDGGWNGLEIDNNKIFAFGNLNDGTPDNKGKIILLKPVKHIIILMLYWLQILNLLQLVVCLMMSQCYKKESL